LESSEREPSYYEVALTHRQVMVGLVVALTTVVVAFFAGIWIGRDQNAPPADVRAGGAAGAGAASEVEKLTFFGDDRTPPAKPATPPAPIAPAPSRPVETEHTAEAAPSAAADSESAKLRQTLEAEMAANRVDGGEPPAIAPGARVSRGETSSTPPAAASPAAPASSPAAAPATGTLWIQVYSSTNGERAREISTRLEKGGFAVRTLAPAGATGANYRVRVGPYPDRRRAERAATRLRREFKLDTWITDSP
jgi:cell division septation protein DedD